ncbi:methionine biosynthesis protein MetW [bacterium]|nr:methionine biosynthesis protein MetW [bacterium]
MTTENRLRNKIVDRIPLRSKVLDLGCGGGELLVQLRNEKKTVGYGIDINYDHILSCVRHGINVFQGNIDEGLKEFSDSSFDYVILSQTLQQVRKPVYVMSEMLRVGRRAIIVFPNFSYWKNRLQMLLGRSPRTRTLPYRWYNTPNIRVVTIKEFRELCKHKHYRIVDEIPLTRSLLIRMFPWLSNLLSPIGMFIIEKGH